VDSNFYIAVGTLGLYKDMMRVSVEVIAVLAVVAAVYWVVSHSTPPQSNNEHCIPASKHNANKNTPSDESYISIKMNHISSSNTNYTTPSIGKNAISKSPSAIFINQHHGSEEKEEEDSHRTKSNINSHAGPNISKHISNTKRYLI